MLGFHAGRIEGVLTRIQRSLHQITDQLLQLTLGELDLQVFWTGVVSGDKGQRNLGGLVGRKIALRRLRSLLDPLDGHRVV